MSDDADLEELVGQKQTTLAEFEAEMWYFDFSGSTGQIIVVRQVFRTTLRVRPRKVENVVAQVVLIICIAIPMRCRVPSWGWTSATDQVVLNSFVFFLQGVKRTT